MYKNQFFYVKLKKKEGMFYYDMFDFCVLQRAFGEAWESSGGYGRAPCELWESVGRVLVWEWGKWGWGDASFETPIEYVQ